MRIKLLFFTAVICGIGGALFKYRDHPYASFFSNHPPRLKLLVKQKAGSIEDPKEVLAGIDGAELSVIADDDGIGLDEVIVRLNDGSREQEFAKKRYESFGTRHDEMPLSLTGKTIGSKPRNAILRITAFNKSFWSQKSEIQLNLTFDFDRPRLEVLTVQHNGTVGGALMTLFRVLSNDTQTVGVKWPQGEYPAFPAAGLDPALAAFPGLYAAIYPIPIGFDVKKDSLKAFARDTADNEGGVVFYQHIAPRSFKSADMKMGRPFFEAKVSELLPKYAEMSKKDVEPPADVTTLPDEELARLFRLVNEDYRALLGEQLRTILKETDSRKLWNGSFIKPMPAAPTASFGEHRHYLVNSADAGNSIHMGIDLAQSAQTPVRSSNDGVVLFADDLGIYGNTVVIDHGLGIATLYGHLSSFSVAKGDQVRKEQELGRTGATGLAGGDHLHFEVRIHGEPVFPIEWLDAHWVGDHIDEQVHFAIKQLNQAAAQAAALKN
jgi:murein DD-endopeptidase MepM/ murein hydrolase activator NlpD